MGKDGASTARGPATNRGDKSARASSASKAKPNDGSKSSRGSIGSQKNKPQAQPLAAAAAPSAAPAKAAGDKPATPGDKPTTPKTPGSTATPATPATPGTPGTPGQQAPSRKKSVGKSSEYKTLTTGPVAIIDFVSEDDGHEGEGEDGAENDGTVLEQKAVEAMGNSWTARQWLEEVENLEGCLADALCADEEGNRLEEEDALAHVRAPHHQRLPTLVGHARRPRWIVVTPHQRRLAARSPPSRTLRMAGWLATGLAARPPL
jgi:hypothetical protein